ncbi:MAG: UPF0149 family protein [Halothiobacillus sp.]
MSVSYPQLANDLQDMGAILSPSESQGVLIGLWLGGGRASEAEWCTELFDEPAVPAMPASVRALFAQVVEQMTTADNLGLTLVFPDDDESFGDRLFAVIEFAQSVLYGYAVAKGPAVAQLPPEALEVFEDIQAIAQLDSQVDDAADAEEDEINLNEIMDYLSAALIVMYISLHPPVPATEASMRQH